MWQFAKKLRHTRKTKRKAGGVKPPLPGQVAGVEGILLLKKVVEGLACVQGARRGGLGDGLLRGLRVGRWRGVFLDGHAKFVEGAGVFRVLRRDALGDGLRTFELGASVEEAALLAAVKLKIALRALTVGIKAGSEDGATVGAASTGDGADHARSARAEVIVLATRAASGRFAFLTMLFLVLLFGIAIAAMAILTVHVRLRLTVRAGGNYQSSHYRANSTHAG